MAWSAPVDPVGGTVITVAYAVSNILDPLRHLRIMTGNADPPASSYVPLSSSTTAVAWSKVTADALAANAVTTHLGYRPVNAGGDDGMLNNFRTTGQFTALKLNAGASGVGSDGPIVGLASFSANGNGAIGGTFTVVNALTAGSYGGGSLVAGSPSFLGVSAGTGGLSTTGAISANGNATIGGILNALNGVTGGSYGGGSLVAGTPSVLGLGVGTNGISLGGPIIGGVGSSLSVAGNVAAGGQVSPASYAGGSTAVGSPSVLGLSVGLGGIASAGPIAVAGNIVYHPGNPPPVSGGAGVPAGLIAFIATGAVPTGWAFYPAANGRVIVGAGSASVGNPQTFVVGNNYGSDWAHAHGPNTFTVTGAATFGPSDLTQASADTNGLATAGGVNLNTTGHRHSLNGASAAVAGSATGTTSAAIWVPPAHALNAIKKD